MAEAQVNQDGDKGNKPDAGIHGRPVLSGIEDMDRFLENLVDKLAFICQGLSDNNFERAGAVALLADIFSNADAFRGDVGNTREYAKELIAYAQNGGGFIPETPDEAAMVQTLRAHRRGWGAGLIPKAVKEAGRILDERFKLPDGSPGEKELAEAIHAALDEMSVKTEKEATHHE